MGRPMLGGLGILAGLAGFFAPMASHPAPIFQCPPIRRALGSGNNAQNPMGTVPNRGLRRIQGRQRAQQPTR